MSDEPFIDPEYLRLLLVRLHYAGPRSWEHDPEATSLILYATAKYAALAHMHGLDETDAAMAALEALRTRTVRTAEDPWAVVTRAVQVTLLYEARAQGLLCSTHQARKQEISRHHDAQRFSEHDEALLEYHPAFHVPSQQDTLVEAAAPDQVRQSEPTNAWMAADDVVELMVASGWPTVQAQGCVDYICSRLLKVGSRPEAYESLRRDRQIEAMLDVTHRSWLKVLRVVLGDPLPAMRHTAAGR